VQTRRLIAVVVVIVLVVVAALLIHSCDVSQTNDSLKSYAGNVYTQVNSSVSTGQSVFKDLKSSDAGNLATVQSELFSAAHAASTQLTQAEDLSTPGAMADAQQSFVQVMKLRYEGIEQIASHIQGAMNRATAVDDVKQITAGASLLYAADVIYKASVGTGIAAALNAANLPIGGATGATINSGQVVSDLGWLNAKTVAIWLGASVPSSTVNSDQPGLHGHSLNSMTANGTTLVAGSLNTVAAKPAPTFSLNITNGGDFDEYDVECKVSVVGGHDSASVLIPETTPHETTNCNVTLPTPPPAGTQTVTGEVVPVTGEKNTANNYLHFSVDFTG
jgi:hypothetical protein